MQKRTSSNNGSSFLTQVILNQDFPHTCRPKEAVSTWRGFRNPNVGVDDSSSSYRILPLEKELDKVALFRVRPPNKTILARGSDSVGRNKMKESRIIINLKVRKVTSNGEIPNHLTTANGVEIRNDRGRKLT